MSTSQSLEKVLRNNFMYLSTEDKEAINEALLICKQWEQGKEIYADMESPEDFSAIVHNLDCAYVRICPELYLK